MGSNSIQCSWLLRRAFCRRSAPYFAFALLAAQVTAPEAHASCDLCATQPLDIGDGGTGEALGINSDGSVAVGYINFGPAPQSSAFRWSQSTGLLPLGGQGSFATAVSGNGSVVVGAFGPLSSRRAFRWTEQSGAVNLGTLPGGQFSYAYGANFDGSVVVGESDVGSVGIEQPREDI